MKAIEMYVSVNPMEFLDNIDKFKKDPCVLRDKVIELLDTKSNEDVKSEEKGEPIILKLFPIQLSSAVDGVASNASCYFIYETEDEEQIEFLKKGIGKLKSIKGVNDSRTTDVLPSSTTIIITTDLIDELSDETDTIEMKKMVDNKFGLFFGDRMPATYSAFFIEPEAGAEHMPNYVTTRALVIELPIIGIDDDELDEVMEDLNMAPFVIDASRAYGVIKSSASNMVS